MNRAAAGNAGARVTIPLALVAFVLAFLAFAPSALASDYGVLSRTFETGGDPADATYNEAYGAYQYGPDNAYEYAKWLAAKSDKTQKAWGNALVAAYKKDKNATKNYFGTVWKYIAGKTFSSGSDDAKRLATLKKTVSIPAGSKSAALDLQYQFTLKQYYSPAVAYWKQVAPTFDPNRYTPALRNVLFSAAVANGPWGSANRIFKLAMQSEGGWVIGMAEDRLINAIYDEWARTTTTAPGSPAYRIKASDSSLATKYGLVGKYLAHYYSSSGNVQCGVYNRVYYRERAAALKMLVENGGNCSHSRVTGGSIAKVFSVNDYDHKEKISARSCSTCGYVVAKSFTRTVRNVYVQKKADYTAGHGIDYTVHKKGYYKVSASKVTGYSSAKSSSKKKAHAHKGAVLKVTKVKFAHKFWWGKVKISGKTCWVKLHKCSKLGTGSSHVFKTNGKCKYCGLSHSRAKRIGKIRDYVKKGSHEFRLAHETTVYKNAYVKKSAAKGHLAKGSRISAKRVVKNRFGDWWVQLSTGGYIQIEQVK